VVEDKKEISKEATMIRARSVRKKVGWEETGREKTGKEIKFRSRGSQSGQKGNFMGRRREASENGRCEKEETKERE